MSQQTLDERVAALEAKVDYLNQNIQAINKATTDTAKAMQAAVADVSGAAETTLASICPFPPNC